VSQLKANGFPNAMLYDPPGVDGTGVVTVLGHGDHPEWYELPADPVVPVSVRINKSIIKPLGMIGIFGTVAASVAHYMGYGPKVARDGVAALPGAPVLPPPEVAVRARSAEDVMVDGEIVRHKLSSRLIHWSVALGFVVALLTGLPIWTPIFGWMAALFGGLQVCRWLHPWAGVFFFAAIVLMFFQWVGQMRFGPQDKGWFGRKMINYFRYKGEDQEAGKYNGGQKILFFLAALMAVLLLLSGVVLWWPEYCPQPLREASWLVHDAIFILFLCAIVVHVYLGTAMEPGTFRSMTRGTVTKDWARLHHPRWYREVTGERERDKPAE
jgi:formate dehydrogenase subunit gamma